MPEDQAGNLFLLIEDRMLNAAADTRGQNTISRTLHLVYQLEKVAPMKLNWQTFNISPQVI